MMKTLSIVLALLLLIILSSITALRFELLPATQTHKQNEVLQLSPHPYPEQMDSAVAALPGISIKRSPSRDLPIDLKWEDGLNEPEIGDPAAIKGGRVRISNAGPYPEFLRPFGGMTLTFFNFTLYTNVEMKLVSQHPQTGHIIPALAQSWAVDGRHVYFKLHPHARYSNGRPVRAGDFVFGIYLRSSPHAQDPFMLSTLSQLESLESIGDDILCVSVKEKNLLAPLIAAQNLHADEPSFYQEFGSDFLDRYAQRVAPTTGGYTLHPEGQQRGRQLVLSRVKDWWAKDLQYYRYSCNVDAIEINFLQSEAQMWELFFNKRLDVVHVRNVASWQERTECPAVWRGQIEKHAFKADYPLPTYGISLNAATIPNLELRRGILAALDMDSALAVMFRGEAERLSCYSEGYGEISPRDIPQAKYDPTLARRYFSKAGYTQRAKDGILMNEQGERLSYHICYSPSPTVESMVQILTSQARACGFELVPLCQPWQKSAAFVGSKQYELAFSAAVATLPLPQLETSFHSRFAPERGKNLHSIQDAGLDAAIKEMNQAADLTQLAAATRRANLRIAELAIWLPGWKENIAYIANWRKLRFPNTPECRFSPASDYEVLESHLYWIDPDFSTEGSYPEIDERIDAAASTRSMN